MYMTLCGDYSDNNSYYAGSVVKYSEDNVVYYALKDVPAGITPHDTAYWQRMDVQATLAMMIDTFSTFADMMDNRFNQYFDLNGKALILPSSTASSQKRFEITVDDDGDVTATEITE